MAAGGHPIELDITPEHAGLRIDQNRFSRLRSTGSNHSNRQPSGASLPAQTEPHKWGEKRGVLAKYQDGACVGREIAVEKRLNLEPSEVGEVAERNHPTIRVVCGQAGGRERRAERTVGTGI